MDQRRVLTLAGILGVLILAIIIGTIVYLTHSFESTSTPRVVTSNPSSIPVYSPLPSASALGRQTGVNTKVYTGGGFQIQYPTSWGLLTCNNSHNIEFDPTNGADQLNFSCNRSIKPITILVGPASCSGTTIKLGSVSVVKSVNTTGGEIDYRWCTQTSPMLDITHRVAQSGTATSINDYSSQIEDIISKIYFGAGS